MAIDDNTVYGLTGAQVKELPEKIEAVKGLAKVLTEADRNYPLTGTKTQVRLDYMEPGIYATNGETLFLGVTPVLGIAGRPEGIAIVLQGDNFGRRFVITSDPDKSGTDLAREWLVLWENQNGGIASKMEFLPTYAVIDTLTTTLTKQPLSANQGKVLNDKIGGDLSNLTTTDKTSLINAINEVAGQGGGGGVTELTSADYNYPTTNPKGIAPWLLDEGIYTTASGVQVYRNENTSTTNPVTFIYGHGSLLWMEGANTDAGIRYSYLSSSGDEFSGASGFLLKSSNVQDNLTSTSATRPLSANQGKVLKDMIDALPTGGITELTSADYDYPDANPTSVALWRLPSGVYTARANVRTASSATRAGDYGGMFFVSQLSANVGDNVLVLANYGGTGGQETKLEYDYTYSDGTAWPNQSGISFIDSREVVDNLTSTRTDYVLSANQGKVLKDMIDNLPTGGVTELTAADYNYPTDNPNRVALWLLSPGIYSTDQGVYVATSDGNSIVYRTGLFVVGESFTTSDGYDAFQVNAIGLNSQTGSWTNFSELVRSSNGTSLSTKNFTPPTVVQTTGTSTTNVMSQNAVTSMVFADPSTKNRVQIGDNANAQASNTVSIGAGANASSTRSVAIGAYSGVGQPYSVALGFASTTSEQGEVGIGLSASYAGNGYNNSNYRLLTGLYDPQSDHDAATKGYCDNSIPATFTTNEWNALWA